MDLTPEQIQEIVNAVMFKVNKQLKDYIDTLEIPDISKLATKKNLSDSIESLKVGIAEEFTKTNEAVNKIAKETETKITELTTKKSKFSDIFKTVLDYED